VWQVFKQKAEFGARMAFDLVQRGVSSIEPVSAPSAGQVPYDGRAQPASDRGTLAPDDLRNQWRAPLAKPRV